MGSLVLEFVLLATAVAVWRHDVTRNRHLHARVDVAWMIAIGAMVVLDLCRLGGGL